MLAIIALPLIAALAKDWLRPALGFLAMILIHLLLDSLVGSIMWT
jgi:hypothetical protein